MKETRQISNGTNETRSVTLTALDSDFAQTLDLSPNSDTYVLSDEDGCADNPAPLQDALWAAEAEGLLKVLIDSGAAAFELAIPDPITALSVNPIERTVWVLTNGNRLQGFDSQGQTLSDAVLELPTPVQSMVVGTQSAWLASGNTVLLSPRDGSAPAAVTDFQEPVGGLFYDSSRDRVYLKL